MFEPIAHGEVDEYADVEVLPVQPDAADGDPARVLAVLASIRDECRRDYDAAKWGADPVGRRAWKAAVNVAEAVWFEWSEFSDWRPGQHGSTRSPGEVLALGRTLAAPLPGVAGLDRTERRDRTRSLRAAAVEVAAFADYDRSAIDAAHDLSRQGAEAGSTATVGELLAIAGTILLPGTNDPVEVAATADLCAQQLRNAERFGDATEVREVRADVLDILGMYSPGERAAAADLIAGGGGPSGDQRVRELAIELLRPA